jgi:hypothetical protein
MKKIQIIGVSGHIGSGKDAFAEILATISNVPVERHAFADKVRDVTELMVGYKMSLTHPSGYPFYNDVYNYTQDGKNVYLPLWNKTIGQCLQLIGTELFRDNFDSDTWVKALFSTTGKKCVENGHILIIPDVRFPNEADAILERGGIVIRLEGDPLGIRKKSKRDLNHISETALDSYKKFTKIIKNEIPDIELFKKEVQLVHNEFILNS